MNECSDALAKKYLQSVKAIYGATENGKPDHIGSCVLLEYQGKNILVTAAHVIDQNKFTSLYVSGETNLVQIKGNCLITSAPNGDRDKDKFDFSILPISKELALAIGNAYFIPEIEWETQELPENERCCLALGFPNSRNKKSDPVKNHIILEPFVYTSTIKRDPTLLEEINFSPSDHYLLDFCSKHSKDSNGKITNSICPKGVSGGGLFLIENMAKPESYRPESECQGKFLGILIEQKKNKKVLVITRVSTIARALINHLTGTPNGSP